MTIKGYADQAKSADGQAQFATVGPVRQQQMALDVIAHLFHQDIANDLAETGSTTRIIKATSHAAIVGDLISWTAGALDTLEYRVAAIPDADHITVAEVMAAAPSNGDAFTIMRPKTPRVSDDGELTVGVTFANDTDYGVVGSDTLRTAAQVGNATGAAAFGAGLVGAQVLRTTPATDSPHLLATRHEAAATPIATRAGNGSAFAAFGAGANAADVPRTTPATDAPHLLATRHETVTTPLAARLSDGTDFIITAALAAAQKTIATATKMLTTLAVAVGWDGTDHRELAVDTSGFLKVSASSGTLTTDQVATSAATFQDGAIAFGALTTNYQTVVTAGGDLRHVSLRNNTNAVIVVSLDSGSTTSYTLDAGDALSLDLKALGLKIASGATLQAKYSGSAPTSGSIRISGVY